MSVNLTPVVSISGKRMLSSPDDVSDSKRNRDDSPTLLSEPAVSADQTLYNSVLLSSEDLSFIASKLNDSFKDQMQIMVRDLVSAMVPEIIKGLEKSVLENVSAAEAENASLRERIEALEMEMDRANQYSRRNSLRVSGIPEEKGENTDTLILNVANSLGANLTEEIDRSHRVGKPRPPAKPESATKPRDILVKFGTYRSRQKLYNRRSQLKAQGNSNCFVNEDLTRMRSSLLFQCRRLKRKNSILDSWSSDGTVLIKDTSGRIHPINSHKDLEVYSCRRSYADVAQSLTP